VSLSKILGPGVRQGYFYARPPYLEKILDRRYDGGNSLLSAAILAAFFKDHLWEHIERANTLLRAKRDATLDALEEHLGDICTCSRPVGGLFIWVKFPDEVDRAKLEALTEARGFMHTPGRHFHVHGTDIPWLRLSFGSVPLDDISEGIGVLGECIREALPERG
jgi:2-aminoadipate transaminase